MLARVRHRPASNLCICSTQYLAPGALLLCLLHPRLPDTRPACRDRHRAPTYLLCSNAGFGGARLPPASPWTPLCGVPSMHQIIIIAASESLGSAARPTTLLGDRFRHFGGQAVRDRVSRTVSNVGITPGCAPLAAEREPVPLGPPGTPHPAATTPSCSQSGAALMSRARAWMKAGAGERRRPPPPPSLPARPLPRAARPSPQPPACSASCCTYHHATLQRTVAAFGRSARRPAAAHREHRSGRHVGHHPAHRRRQRALPGAAQAVQGSAAGGGSC